MTKQLTYKGYSATVEFDAEDRLFFGRLNGIADSVTFHGESAAELVEAFEQAVDGYLAMSEQLGRAPQSPHVRRIIVRVPPISMPAPQHWRKWKARAWTCGRKRFWCGRPTVQPLLLRPRSEGANTPGATR